MVPVALSVHRARRGLERAMREGATFHLWFHPFNLASDVNGLLGGLESIFQEVHRLVKADRLTNPTMGELAASLARLVTR